jgi:ATP-dependent exoDNAse (exonuclease V) beta subunit
LPAGQSPGGSVKAEGLGDGPARGQGRHRQAALDDAAQSHPPSKEIVVVQGLIDLLVRTPEGLLVLDFKTDHVFGADVRQRAEVYRGQLELYARAATDICREKVLQRWLYFLAPRQAVEV